MPPLPPVPQVVKVMVKGQVAAANPTPWENVFHLQYSGGAPSIADLTAFGNTIFTAWSTHMAPEQVNNLSMTEVEVIDLTSSTAASIAVVGSAPGSRGDDELPSNVAFLINYPINRRYKGGHPRNYLLVGGISDFLDGNHWSTAFTAEVGTHWTAFLDALVGHTQGSTNFINLVSVSYYSGKQADGKPALRATPLIDLINVATLVPEQQLATQRRRVGRHRS